jgi:hypothetical protein
VEANSPVELGLAKETIEALFNGAGAAVFLAKQLFTLVGLHRMTDVDQVLTRLCRAAAGQPGSAIAQGAEKETGERLTDVIWQSRWPAGTDHPMIMGAKYKPVDKKKKPVPISMPPLKRLPYKPIPPPPLPPFPTHPPRIEDFEPTERLTRDRVSAILKNVDEDFLSEEELSLLFWVLAQNEQAIAFDDSERGTYKTEYFPDYIMETITHTPWQLPPIRIPESIKDEMRDMLKKQMESGNLELSHSSYRSRVFVVQKPKGGLRIVHDLQPLNLVSVQDAMLPPNVSEFAESFAGHSVYGTMDLYSGYHQRRIHEDSRPLTACQTPLGNVQLTTLPMGYTNSMQEFQRATAHIISALSPDKADNFVDDVGVKGPTTRYGDEPIPENPAIRRFIWEYAHSLYETLAALRAGGATASGKKLVLAMRRVEIVGHLCDLWGMRPHHGVVTKVLSWPTPRSVTEVRGFLGTVGVARNWIRNFARMAKPLTLLTKLLKHEYQWNEEAQQAMDSLKQAVSRVSALKKLDIRKAKQASLSFEPGELNEGRLILAVDSSIIAIGYVLYQVFYGDDEDLAPPDRVVPGTESGQMNHKTKRELKRYPIRFGSITLKEAESRYSQPKVELFGLFRALKALQHIIWGVNIRVEVDASFLKATANAPGLPSASTTRWVAYIQLFDLEFVHTKAERHMVPDGLSRRRRAEEDTDDTEIEEEDVREEGSFIKASTRELHGEPPHELPLEPTKGDLHFISATRLAAQPGEPINIIARRKGPHTETLQLLYAEPTSDPDDMLCEYALAQVPPKKRKASEVLGMSGTMDMKEPAQTRKAGPPKRKVHLLHPHHTLDRDSFEHWANIISYLESPTSLPKGIKHPGAFRKMASNYYIYNEALWRRGKQGPRRVILKQGDRDEIIRQAHDESGHRGVNPTFLKICDFYFWPNMRVQVSDYCVTCKECQLRSSHYPKVMINPTWVPTILRKFNLDVVDMGISSSGFRYIVDMRDDLSGWLEARMLTKKTSEAVADFLWQDVICRFGCIPQITTDNGTEFQKAVNIITKKYGITVIRISPYNPIANGMIERGHRTWITSIWKLCGKQKDKWAKWFYSALWADRVTTRKPTGYSPYYLLYGKPHLFPYNLSDETWYTINWHDIETTAGLLAARAIQIQHMRMDRQKAASHNMRARIQAAKDFAIKNARRLVSGSYNHGQLVLVALRGPGIVRGLGAAKSEDTWAGPFRVIRHFKSGSYQLEELDGALIKGSVPAGHLKPFYSQGNVAGGRRLYPESESSEEGNQFTSDNQSEFCASD